MGVRSVGGSNYLPHIHTSEILVILEFYLSYWSLTSFSQKHWNHSFNKLLIEILVSTRHKEVSWSHFLLKTALWRCNCPYFTDEDTQWIAKELAKIPYPVEASFNPRRLILSPTLFAPCQTVGYFPSSCWSWRHGVNSEPGHAAVCHVHCTCESLSLPHVLQSPLHPELGICSNALQHEASTICGFLSLWQPFFPLFS